MMVTHMNAEVLAHLPEIRAAGVLIAEDGAVLDLCAGAVRPCNASCFCSDVPCQAADARLGVLPP